MEVDADNFKTVLEKIREIAQGAAPKIVDLSAKGYLERIAGLADSALSRNQAEPGSDGHGGLKI
jgi:hypothetical protein